MENSFPKFPMEVVFTPMIDMGFWTALSQVNLR